MNIKCVYPAELKLFTTEQEDTNLPSAVFKTLEYAHLWVPDFWVAAVEQKQ